MQADDNTRALIEPTFLSLGQISHHNALVHGDVAASTQSGRVTTWQQFEAYANRVANGLRAFGMPKGQRIVYLGKTTDYAYQIMHGVAKAEYVFTPLNWRLTVYEIDVVLSDANPAEVEATLSRAPEVRKIAIVGVEDEKWEEVPVAFVVAFSGDDSDLAMLNAYAKEYLAKFKIPKLYKLVEELPQNVLNKVLKTELREMARTTTDWLIP